MLRDWSEDIHKLSIELHPRLSGLREAERVWDRMEAAERAEGRMDEMLKQFSSYEDNSKFPQVVSKSEQRPLTTSTRAQNGITALPPTPNGLLKMRKKIMAESSIPRGGNH